MSTAERRLRTHERQPILSPEQEAMQLLAEIRGEAIEHRLLSLAQIGGTPLEPTPELPERYSVNRLALSETDIESRQFLNEWMQEAGMDVTTHAAGVFGQYPGTNPDLAAVIMLSHFDSVPEAGMYDGAVGIMSAIEIVKQFHQNNIQFPHPIIVAAFTGEESAGFDMALFGSRAGFHGLTDKELAASRPGGATLKQAVMDAGFDPTELKQPIFTPNQIEAVVELHVAQDDRLKDGIAIVEAIAAPERFQAKIGEERLTPETQLFPELINLQLHIRGQTGHSGATPMNTRADGLVVASEIIREFIANNPEMSMDDVTIDGQAMNKIPGKVDCHLRVPQRLVKKLQTYMQRKNHQLEGSGFGENALSLNDSPPQENKTDYSPASLLPRQQAAAEAIHVIHSICNKYGDQNIVGTVGTYRIDEGVIKLGIDIRGIDLEIRNKVVAEIQQVLKTTLYEKNLPEVDFGNALPGSGEPDRMDDTLVKTAKDLADAHGITPTIIMFSPAGHDIQNAVRETENKTGIPGVLLFLPSRNGGIAHTPDEYSTPKDLENGARAMAALVMHLAA